MYNHSAVGKVAIHRRMPMNEYTDALELFSKHPKIQETEHVPLDHAFGRILAQDVHAPCDLPLFDTSDVDGVALRLQDVSQTLHIDGIRHACAVKDKLDNPDCKAVQIMTGARIPSWSDVVVPGSCVSVIKKKPKTISVPDVKNIRPGQYIRHQGESYKKGELVCSQGHYLQSESLMKLAHFGIHAVSVIKRPKVWLATSGDEVREPGETIKDGEIFNAAGVYLRSQVYALGLNVHYQRHLNDVASKMGYFLQSWLESPAPALLITTGAVSMGPQDMFPRLAKDLGLHTQFCRCASGPTKPILFASHGNTHYWVGAPGDCASTQACWQFFIREFLHHWVGIPSLVRMQPQLARDDCDNHMISL